MAWNHRVLAHSNSITDEVYLQIHEVYYSKRGKIKGYSLNANIIGGETVEDLKWTLEMMSKCLEKPILDANNFPNEYKQKQSNEEI